jgi:hypothetical protein
MLQVPHKAAPRAALFRDIGYRRLRLVGRALATVPEGAGAAVLLHIWVYFAS